VSALTAQDIANYRRQLAEAQNLATKHASAREALVNEYKELDKECQQQLGCTISELPARLAAWEGEVRAAEVQFQASVVRTKEAAGGNLR
jgi:hypothetical protein